MFYWDITKKKKEKKKKKHLEGESDARSSVPEVTACRQVAATCGRWT